MRLLNAPAVVTLTSDGNPQAVAWQHPHHGTRHAARPRRVITVIDTWRYDGRWWEERELHRDHYLLELDGGVQAEIFRENDAWWVARITD